MGITERLLGVLGSNAAPTAFAECPLGAHSDVCTDDEVMSAKVCLADVQIWGRIDTNGQLQSLAIYKKPVTWTGFRLFVVED